MRTAGTLMIFVFTLLAATTQAHAESPREQLNQMVAELQKTPGDNVLRERIVKLGATLKPSPALSDAAISFEGRAQFAFKSAKSEGDFLTAAREYEKAVAIAPWVPGYYADLCTIYEKAGKFEEAKRHCGFYLSSLTDPGQMTDVKRRIAGLEFGIEKANSPEALAEREREEFATFLRQNEGAVFKYFWAADYSRMSYEDRRKTWWEAVIDKGVLMIGRQNQTEEHLWYNPHRRGMKPHYTIYQATGFISSTSFENPGFPPSVVTITFSRDGKTLTKEYDTESYVKGPNDDPNNNTYSKFDKVVHSVDVFHRQ
jgi:hypothetical protein